MMPCLALSHSLRRAFPRRRRRGTLAEGTLAREFEKCFDMRRGGRILRALRGDKLQTLALSGCTLPCSSSRHPKLFPTHYARGSHGRMTKEAQGKRDIRKNGRTRRRRRRCVAGSCREQADFLSENPTVIQPLGSRLLEEHLGHGHFSRDGSVAAN